MVTYFILAITILLNVAAQLSLKKGALALSVADLSVASLGGLIFKVFQNIYLFLGLLCFGLSFFLWVIVLSRMKLGAAYATSLAITLALVILTSFLLFKEQMSLWQWVGLVFVIIGIFLLLWKF